MYAAQEANRYDDVIACHTFDKIDEDTRAESTQCVFTPKTDGILP